MKSCDMCGSEGAFLKTTVEGTVLTVCKGCAKYGKVVGRERTNTPRKFKKKTTYVKPAAPEVMEIVVSNYSNLIKKSREKLGLKQEELASKLAEKESLIQHMETKKFKPSIMLAKKIEKFLHIKLVEEYEEKSKFRTSAKNREVTIADFIKIKKKK